MTSVISCVAALCFTLSVAAGVARAECEGEYQFPIKDLDNAVMRDLMLTAQSEMERFFNVELDVFCMDDEELGAFYRPRTNTMVIGTDFFFETANPPGNINNVLAVLSHEIAHTFQVHHGLLDHLVSNDLHRVKCIELHADFLAGGYMGWRSRTYDVEIKSLTKLFFGFGDNVTSDQSHHGLPQERFLSFRAGFASIADDEVTLSSMGMGYVAQAKCDEI
jgi:predicted metalloprotease